MLRRDNDQNDEYGTLYDQIGRPIFSADIQEDESALGLEEGGVDNKQPGGLKFEGMEFPDESLDDVDSSTNKDQRFPITRSTFKTKSGSQSAPKNTKETENLRLLDRRDSGAVDPSQCDHDLMGKNITHLMDEPTPTTIAGSSPILDDQHRACRHFEGESSSSTTMVFPSSPDSAQGGSNVDLRRELCSQNLFVFHLPSEWREEHLSELFSCFGKILSVKVVKRPDMTSKGYGFVCFEDPESAKIAVEAMDGYAVTGKRLKVSIKKTPEECLKLQVQKLMRMADHRDTFDRERDCSLFVFHLPPQWEDQDLKQRFAPFGPIVAAKVSRKEDGTSRGYGFVTCADPRSAALAIMQLNGLEIGHKRLKVQPKQMGANTHPSKPDRTVFVFHLPNDWTDIILRQYFSNCGRVVSATVQRDSKGRSRGFGFVTFDRPQSARDAVHELNGSTVGTKRLKVSLKRLPQQQQRQQPCSEEDNDDSIHPTSNQTYAYTSPTNGAYAYNGGYPSTTGSAHLQAYLSGGVRPQAYIPSGPGPQGLGYPSGSTGGHHGAAQTGAAAAGVYPGLIDYGTPSFLTDQQQQQQIRYHHHLPSQQQAQQQQFLPNKLGPDTKATDLGEFNLQHEFAHMIKSQHQHSAAAYAYQQQQAAAAAAIWNQSSAIPYAATHPSLAAANPSTRQQHRATLYPNNGPPYGLSGALMQESLRANLHRTSHHR